MEMKLNQMPNNQGRKFQSLPTIIAFHQLASLLTGAYHLINCHDQVQATFPATSPTRDVTNLRLAPDFRAVSLSWSYTSHGDIDRPASFDVRYCEMTSWNIEIKCRHRDMEVLTANHGSANESKTTQNLVHHLDAPLGSNYEARIYDLRALTNYTFQVRVSRFQHEQPPVTTTLAPLSSNSSGRVVAERRQRTQAAARQLAAAATTAADDAGERAAFVKRIETKPFGAEATKCLADVSEVLVNTGRYFGGRISVEDSQDPRCNLIGNKSSEQDSYLFRIDHEICASKLVDGNRIETMVLVHENKDILTHNTARFLVLCNFQQTKSFTLRASVSLPKVNSLGGSGSRPAVITSLPGRPSGSNRQQNPLAEAADDNPLAGASHVMLGSMPGIYRARSAGANSAALDLELETNTIAGKSQDKKQELRAALGGSHYEMSDVAMSAAESAPSQSTTANLQQQLRQAKELSTASAQGNNNLDNLEPLRRHSNSARSLITTETGSHQTPQPVQVQSRVLFIERGGGGFSRGARHHKVLDGLILEGKQRQVMTSNHSAAQVSVNQQAATATSQIESTAYRQNQNQNNNNDNERLLHTTSPMPKLTLVAPNAHVATDTAAQSREARKLHHNQQVENSHQQNQKQPADNKKQSRDESAELDQVADLRTIIMTNNHRVAGDYLPVSVAASRAAKSRVGSSNSPGAANNSGAAEGDNFSIKYSAAKVDEFPLARADPPQPFIEFPGNGQLGSRRMKALTHHRRRIDLAPESVTTSSTGTPDTGRNAMMSSDFDASTTRSVWSVNRMGELMAEGGDLASAETSNETQSSDEMMIQNQVRPTLAANLTSALLKWSLKTLGNIAKMSLETLAESHMNSTNYDNETSPADSAIHSQTGESPSFVADRLTSTTSSTNRPLLVTSVVQQPTKSSTRQVSTTPALAVSRNARPPDEPQTTELDGFVTSEHKHRPSRPSNYSKSLDLSRLFSGRPSKISDKNGTRSSDRLLQSASDSESSQKNTATTSALPIQTLTAAAATTTTTTSTTTTTKPQRNHHRPRLNESGANGNRLLQSAASHPSAADNLTFYSSWLFYGMILLVVTVTGIVLVLYLLDSTPLSSGPSGPGAMLCGQINCSAVRPFDDATSTSGGDATSCQGIGGSSISATSNTSLVRDCYESPVLTYQRYADYNKFENYPTISASRLHLLQQQQQQQHSCGRQQRTDSCSGGSSASTDYVATTTRTSSDGSASRLMRSEENDCRNNELFFTEHVLINAQSTKFGTESYA